eukprot:347468-Chlamydomonas_euryale.AAC.3
MEWHGGPDGVVWMHAFQVRRGAAAAPDESLVIHDVGARAVEVLEADGSVHHVARLERRRVRQR